MIDCCTCLYMLKQQVNDEKKGWGIYSQISKDLKDAGQPVLSTVVQHISDTEFKHYLELEGMIKVLAEDCGCKVEDGS